jgi:hypothetical protein
MSSSQDFTGLEIISKEQTVTPFIRVQVEPDAIGWSSHVFTFQKQGLNTSTVLEEPSSGETQSLTVWFEEGAPGDPRDLSKIAYLDEDFSQIPSQIATGASTKISVLNNEPIMSAVRASGGCMIFKPTLLQNSVYRRISELMELAVEDEIEMSPSSFSDLWSFISARPAVSVPNVFALDNGNFRAVWKNSEGERVALEFQGNKTVGFVIFEYDRSVGKMMRMAGIQGVNRIQAQITAAYADHLLTR